MTTKHKIDSGTKISTLIAMNPDTIEVIASINKNFRKLRNPILRKTLAKRVNIKDAARIGNVDVDVLLNKLKEIGFDIASGEAEKENSREGLASAGNTGQKQEREQKHENMKVIELDVRPELEKGIDPFQSIMKKIKTLKEGEVLQVINTFEPLPLINVLKKKGYRSWTEREQGVVLTYFQKTEDSEIDNLETAQNLDNSDFEKKLAGFAGKLVDVDVRGLEMPEPMMTILQKLEELEDGQALFVHHERIPQYLKPELDNRHYKMLVYTEDDDNVKLLIYK